MTPLTILSVPLPFEGPTGIKQRNAIHSWTLLDPEPEIILLGTEKGTLEIVEDYHLADVFSFRHFATIKRNPLGDLSMRSILRSGDRLASYDTICYVDSDVILMSDFYPMVKRCIDWAGVDGFVTCAGRWDAKISTSVPFGHPDWESWVVEKVYKKGQKGSDYFVYPKGFFHDIPDFSIGRGWWDGWRMGYTKRQGLQLINVEQVCKAVHQRHGHRWSGQKGTGRNRRLMGNCEAWIKDATAYLEGIPNA